MRIDGDWEEIAGDWKILDATVPLPNGLSRADYDAPPIWRNRKTGECRQRIGDIWLYWDDKNAPYTKDMYIDNTTTLIMPKGWRETP